MKYLKAISYTLFFVLMMVIVVMSSWQLHQNDKMLDEYIKIVKAMPTDSYSLFSTEVVGMAEKHSTDPRQTWDGAVTFRICYSTPHDQSTVTVHFSRPEDYRFFTRGTIHNLIFEKSESADVYLFISGQPDLVKFRRIETDIPDLKKFLPET